MNKKLLSGMVAILCLAAWGVAEAMADVFVRENKAEMLYGQGVHAFFDGDYRSSVQNFEQVEKLGSEDPRPYFFLALAYSRLDQNDKADPMFQKAARMERESRTLRDFDVSGALRRIQGNERMMLEQYRNQARTDWQKTETKRRNELYRKEDTKRKDVLAALAQSFTGAAPFGARSLDPFRGEKDEEVEEEKIQYTTVPKAESEASVQEAPGTAQTPMKKDDDDMEEDDPFAEPAKKDEKKDDDDMEEDDPFGEPAKKDEKKDDADMEEDDPFAEPAKKDEKKDDADMEEDDPFGEPAKKDEKKDDADMEEDDPFAEPAKKDEKKGDADMEEDDPFAEPAKKDEKKADDDMEEDDPFAEPAKKDEKKADDDMEEDDPFAEPAKKDEKKDDVKEDDSKETEDDEEDPFQ